MSFHEDDSSFSLDTIPVDSAEKLNSGLWLVLLGINEIPPHIALISEGKYYSLSARKVDCGTSLERLMNTLERKRIPALFVNIVIKPQTPKGALKPSTSIQSRFRGLGLRDNAIKLNQILQEIYKNLQPLGNSSNTCLSPIKDFFAEHYSAKFASINYVFELLALAEKKELLKECVSFHTENNGINRITLPKYTMSQIRNKIDALSPQINVSK